MAHGAVPGIRRGSRARAFSRAPRKLGGGTAPACPPAGRGCVRVPRCRRTVRSRLWTVGWFPSDCCEIFPCDVCAARLKDPSFYLTHSFLVILCENEKCVLRGDIIVPPSPQCPPLTRTRGGDPRRRRCPKLYGNVAPIVWANVSKLYIKFFQTLYKVFSNFT